MGPALCVAGSAVSTSPTCSGGDGDGMGGGGGEAGTGGGDGSELDGVGVGAGGKLDGADGESDGPTHTVTLESTASMDRGGTGSVNSSDAAGGPATPSPPHAVGSTPAQQPEPDATYELSSMSNPGSFALRNVLA
jgi:hypothetical protein